MFHPQIAQLEVFYSSSFHLQIFCHPALRRSVDHPAEVHIEPDVKLRLEGMYCITLRCSLMSCKARLLAGTYAHMYRVTHILLYSCLVWFSGCLQRTDDNRHPWQMCNSSFKADAHSKCCSISVLCRSSCLLMLDSMLYRPAQGVYIVTRWRCNIIYAVHCLLDAHKKRRFG